MDERYRAFFVPVGDNAIKNVQFYMRAANFQKKQYIDYLRHLWNIEGKLQKLTETKQKLLDENKDLAMKLEKIKTYRRNLQQELKRKDISGSSSSGYGSSAEGRQKRNSNDEYVSITHKKMPDFKRNRERTKFLRVIHKEAQNSLLF